MTRIARLVSTGCHLPSREISNDLLRETHGEVIDKFEAATGIETRWWTTDDRATSDLALEASLQALEGAGVAPEDLDLILLGTDSPDYITPATSAVLQHKLGAHRAGTFDIACACASFPTGFATAAGWIATNPSIQNVLVVGAYLMHRLADPSDPTIFFYGDGAGAAVLQAGEAPGFLTAAVQSDGSYAKHWGIYSGGTAEPASEASIREGRTVVRMVDRYPPEINDQGWPRLLRRLAQQGDFAIDAIDHFIFTQVRKPTIEIVMDELGVPVERAHMVMQRWGYTGSACIPMALHDAYDQDKIEPGQLVVLIGTGVGWHQAAVAYRA